MTLPCTGMAVADAQNAFVRAASKSAFYAAETVLVKVHRSSARLVPSSTLSTSLARNRRVAATRCWP